MSIGSVDVVTIVIQVVILLFALSVHESAHAWTADRLGDPTARRLGRVSLNPLVHLDLVGSLLFPLMGLALGGVVFGWAKPVPVNPVFLKNPRADHALVAAAGPASNVLLAIACLLGLKLLGDVSAGPIPVLAMAFYYGLILNVILAVFNLMPIPPLDGGWILSGMLPQLFGKFYDLIRPYSFVLLIMLLYTGVFSVILRPVLAFVRQLAL